MTDIDHVGLRQLDLSLLLIFLGLMRHRKGAAVATEMGLTQSAISHALGRLRVVFDDPMFLRKPHGMEPTAVARALEPQIAAAVRTLDAALNPPAPFDPTAAEGVVRISALDYELATIFPAALTRIAAAAPGLRLAVKSLDRSQALAALDTGEADLVVGFFWDPPEFALLEPLFDDHYLVAGRKGHPTIAAMPALQDYLTARHLLVSPNGKLFGIVDRTLKRAGEVRNVAVAVPQFMSALAILAETELIATLPARLVSRHAGTFGLAAAEPPVAIRSFTSSVARHRRDEKNPIHLWLIEQFRAAVAP